MRKIIAFIAALLMVLPLSACGTSAADDHTETYDSVCVDVSAHEDGFYSLMSNVEIHYYDGGMGYISINDPTLLAFQVSSMDKGGVWMLDLDDAMLQKADYAGCASGTKEDKSELFAYHIADDCAPMIDASPVSMACTVEDV